MTGDKPRSLFRARRQVRLSGLKHVCRLSRGLARGLQRRIMSLGGGSQFGLFAVQPLDGLTRVAVQSAFAFDVPRKLGDPSGQRLDGRPRARLLIGERVALHVQTLHNRGCNRGFLAQRWQGILGSLPFLARPRHDALRRGGRTHPFPQFRIRPCPGIIRIVPAPVKQHALRAAQLFADFPVPRCLLCLPRKLCKLGGELFDHVVDPGKVRLRRVKLQLRLMPPLIKPGDTCRFFEDTPPVPGLGVDQFRDLPLSDQCRAMGTSRGIGKQHLNVARPHVFAPRLVGTAHIPGDPPHDFKLIVVVKARRGEPFAVVHVQGDFGEIAGGSGGGTGKNHILHPAAAHGSGAVFPHDPAQSFEQV